MKPASGFPQKKLFAHWNFLSGSGGITGKGPGWTKENQIHIQFKKNGSYYFFENGKPKTCDKFLLIEKNSLLTGQKVNMIDYRNGSDQSFRISGDTLFLQDEMQDGFSYIFLKK
ncbi:MAG: hypothetical protein PSX36_01105 [bacterium]|nr:hypothetical protein [bacterium]